MSRGFPLSEIDNWNTGMLIDWAMEYDRMQKRQNGEYVPDELERYKQLKAMEQQIEELNASGRIKPEKYKSYRNTLEECERKLRR